MPYFQHPASPRDEHDIYRKTHEKRVYGVCRCDDNSGCFGEAIPSQQPLAPRCRIHGDLELGDDGNACAIVHKGIASRGRLQGRGQERDHEANLSADELETLAILSN